MKQVYPVIFTQLNDKKDTVLINVPDMNILTEGFGLPDAIEMARDAIGANGITLQDLGREIPVPSDISDIDIKNGPFDNTGISHVSFVDIDFDEYRRKVDNKTVRRNVTLPNWLNQAARLSWHFGVGHVLTAVAVTWLIYPPNNQCIHFIYNNFGKRLYDHILSARLFLPFR